jgi:hypothetical protein
MENGMTRLGGRPTLTRGLHRTGRKLYVEMSFALVRDATGSVLGSVAVARDATERIEREKAAVAAQPEAATLGRWPGSPSPGSKLDRFPVRSSDFV